MKILEKFKKVILLLFFSIIFSATALNQTGSAITLTPTDNFTTLIPDGGSYTNYLDVSLLPLEQQAPESRDIAVSFMKFDISSLKGLTLNSSTINLYGLGSGTLNLFYVADNSFVNQSITHNINQAELDALLGQKLVDGYPVSSTLSWHSLSSSDLLTQLITSVNTPGNNYFSVALKQGTAGSAASFYSNESTSYSPNLDVPIPEPSSIILSLISLGGILGFNKNRGKLL